MAINTNRNIEETIVEWAAEVTDKHSDAYVLVHADDGVIWGIVKDGNLTLDWHVYPELKVLLRWETVQQLRLFGSTAERFVWRDHTGWRSAYKTDDDDDEVIKQHMLLWGEVNGPPDQGFCLCKEGAQGLMHAPPAGHLSGVGPGAQLRLVVHQSIQFDESHGQMVINNARLVRFELVTK